MRLVRTLSGAATALAIAGTLVIDGRAEQASDSPQFSQALADMNLALAAAGSPYRIDRAEISVSIDGIDTAQTLIANNRTHQIESLFAERDPRRGGGSDISYLVDQSDGAALAFANPTGNAVVDAGQRGHRADHRSRHAALAEQPELRRPAGHQAHRQRHRPRHRRRAGHEQPGPVRHAAGRHHPRGLAAAKLLRAARARAASTTSSASPSP